MKVDTILLVIVFIIVLSVPVEASPPGFSISGGLLLDYPSSSAYESLESGIGYIGTFGFDIHPRAGIEIGVLHSTHDYIFALEGNAYRKKEAEKNTLFFKLRAIPLKYRRADILLGAGPALFDISGERRFNNTYDLEDGFSGWGAVISLDLRYFVSDYLALTLYFSGNIVKYSKYSINSLNTDYAGGLPRGNSFSWGLTVYHRIGMPKI